MGWTYFSKPASPKEYLDKQLTWTNDGASMRCLRSAFVGLTYYAAVEATRKDGKRDVFAMVILVRYTRDGDMGYKDMDETMGPNESRCPKTILDLLTPTDSEYAIEWRKRCAAFHANKSTMAKAPGGTAFMYGGRRYVMSDEKASKRGGRIAYAVGNPTRYTFGPGHLAQCAPAGE